MKEENQSFSNVSHKIHRRRLDTMRTCALILFLSSCYLAMTVSNLKLAHITDEATILALRKQLDDIKGRWDIEELPIQRSISKGFHPVYFYSNPKTAESELQIIDKEKAVGLRIPYAQVKQDRIILALTKANDKKIMSLDTSSSSEHLRREQHETITAQHNNKNKYFVDLAANHAIYLSNTLRLEQDGWNGICIEGNPEYLYLQARHRKCTIVGAYVGGTDEDNGKQVEVVFRGEFGGIIGNEMDNKSTNGYKSEKRDLVSILTVFKETSVPNLIDYFSLDVEGAESLVMADFPWEEYKFRFMTVERPRADLKKALEANGYSLVKTLSTWGETLWVHKESVLLSLDEIQKISTDILNAS